MLKSKKICCSVVVKQMRAGLSPRNPYGFYPPTQKATVFEAVGECVEGTLRSSYERSGVCFGGIRPTKHVEEPRAPARGGRTWKSVLHDDHSLTHHSDAILTSKRIFNPFLGIWVVM